MSLWLCFALPCLAALTPLARATDNSMPMNDVTNTPLDAPTGPPTPPPLPATTTTTPRPSLTTPRPCQLKEPDWNDPSDVVLILDASASFGERSFNNVKKFFRRLIETTMVLRANATRLAILTFAGEVQTVENYISGDTQVPECALFRDKGVWDLELAWKSNKYGENIKDALSTAADILKLGREAEGKGRSGHKQRVWIASDVHKFANADDFKILAQLKEVADVYGVGDGPYLNVTEETRFREYVSSPSECFYNRLDNGWDLTITNYTRPLIKQKSGEGEVVSYVGGSCSCVWPEIICQCPEFSGNPGPPQCGAPTTNAPTEGEKDGFPWWIILAISAGGIVFLLILVLIIVVICRCIRTDKATPVEENTPTNTGNSLPRANTTSGNIFKTSTSSDHVYANDIVPEIIREHTIPKNGNSEHSPALPPRDPRNNDAPRPPGLPIPLSSSFRSIASSRPPYYIDVLEDTQHRLHPTTFPSPSANYTMPFPAPNQQYNVPRTANTTHTVPRQISVASSGLYEHIMHNRSRQTSNRTQRPNSEDSENYLCMEIEKITTETQTSMASRFRNFRRTVSRVFGKPNDMATQTVRSPRPHVNPKKFQGKANTIQAKRNSAKVGTVRFKSLIAKFDQEHDGEGEDVPNEPVDQPSVNQPSVNQQSVTPSMSRQSSCMDDVL